MQKKRLFIVANRLPVQITGEKDQAKVKSVSGGLVSAVNSYLQNSDNVFDEVSWTGIPGCSPATWKDICYKIEESTFNLLPVLVYDDQYEKYYNGFSNSVLWPLFHYFPSYAEYRQDEYDEYMKVNELFAEILLKNCREGDTIWIHDYHLFPLAEILRRQMPDITIGFFLHIPFPSYEVLRLMPRKWQESILKGMLGADLIGFHTIDYATHFLDNVQKSIGLENDRNILRYNDRLVSVGVFPIGVDYQQFHSAYDKNEVSSIRRALLEKMEGLKIIFSVDRLDYTKGVRNRLLAFELFLKQNPAYAGKVVFVMNLVPSRDSVPKYVERKKIIDEIISRINSAMGNLHWQPIIYRYSSMDFHEMIALYTACDLALITPLRDGMNLVSKEFIASRKDGKGVLIISEMAGAAKELSSALQINPNDIQEMAEKILQGLEMKEEEQKERISNMQRRISRYDVKAWAEDFVNQLDGIKQKQQNYKELFLDEYSKRKILDQYRHSQNRLLLLDYDGTLVPFTNSPDQARPGIELLKLISELTRKEDTELYIISGRSAEWLEAQFEGLPLNLIAEHGAMVKTKNGKWHSELPLSNEWKDHIRMIMETYVSRCPNSFIEIKQFSMVWHYRNSDPEQGQWNAHALICELNEFLVNTNLHVVQGNKIIEIKNRGIDKGSAVKKVVAGLKHDFIFAVGDDRTDEDMFKVLINHPHAYTIKVGPKASYAKYNLMKPQMVISLLEHMNQLPLQQPVST